MEGPSNSNIADRLKVAIIGGGICGLLCAIVLKRHNFEVDIYESAVSVLPRLLQKCWELIFLNISKAQTR